VDDGRAPFAEKLASDVGAGDRLFALHIGQSEAHAGKMGMAAGGHRSDPVFFFKDRFQRNRIGVTGFDYSSNDHGPKPYGQVRGRDKTSQRGQFDPVKRGSSGPKA
jgi:hypothetical protein